MIQLADVPNAVQVARWAGLKLRDFTFEGAILILALMLLSATPSPGLPVLGKPVGSLEDWIGDGDFRRDAAGVVRFKTIFTPEGALDRCIVTVSSGNKLLEQLVCALAVKRFRFQKSIGSDGQPTYRVFDRSANFSEAPSPAEFSKPIFTLSADDLLKAGKFNLVVDVDANGNLKACVGSDKRGSPSVEASARACNEIAQLWKPLTEQNSLGEPISYVRDIRIEVAAAPRRPRSE